MAVTSALLRALRNNFLFSITTAVLQIALTAITARLLSPDDYGQFAIAGSVIAISNTIGARGISINLLRTERLDGSEITSSYLTAALISLSISILILIAPILLDFHLDGMQINLVRCSALIVILNFISTPALSLLQRDLKTGLTGRINLAAIFFGNGLATLVFAAEGFGAWSLFLGAVGNASINAILSFLAAKPTLAFTFSFSRTRHILVQALIISGLRGIDTLWLQLPILIQSSNSSYELGLFQRMHFLSLLIFQVTIGSTLATLLPVAAALKGNQLKLQEQFLQFFRITTFAVAALVIPGCFSANEIVNLIFGEQWTAGANILRPALAAGAFFSASMLPVVFKEGCGLNALRYLVSITTIISFIILYIIFRPTNAHEIALCFAASAIILFVFSTVLVGNWLNITASEVYVNLLPAIFLSALLATALGSMRYFIHITEFHPLIKFTISACVTLICVLPLIMYAFPNGWKSFKR